MKKNIFKFAYVALTAAAMIVIGQHEAKADIGDCMQVCNNNMNICAMQCDYSTRNSSDEWAFDECMTGCASPMTSCIHGCLSQE